MQSQDAGVGHPAAKPECQSRQSQQPVQWPRKSQDPAINSSLRTPSSPLARPPGVTRTGILNLCGKPSTWRDHTSHLEVWFQYCNVTSAVKLLLPTAVARGLPWLGRETPRRLSAARLC